MYFLFSILTHIRKYFKYNLKYSNKLVLVVIKMVLDKPTILYSEFCNYSMQFLNILGKHPQLHDNIEVINIDPLPNTNQRPPIFYNIQSMLQFAITEVPSVIINKGEYVLAGEEAFKWLDYEIQNLSKEELSPFNPNEMGAFSDTYSMVNSSDVTDQCFKFIDKPDQKIQTPQETASMTKDEYSSKQKEREQFSNNIKQINQIDFTDKKFFRQSNNSGTKKDVSDELNKKFEELMMQRKSESTKKVPKNIDFTA